MDGSSVILPITTAVLVRNSVSEALFRWTLKARLEQIKAGRCNDGSSDLSFKASLLATCPPPHSARLYCRFDKPLQRQVRRQVLADVETWFQTALNIGLEPCLLLRQQCLDECWHFYCDEPGLVCC